MIKLKVDFESAKILKALKKLDDYIHETTLNFIKAEGPEMEREIKQSMKVGGRKKRPGPRGGKVRVHSLAGQVPFVQSGVLKSSIGSKLHIGKNDVSLDIGAIRGGKEVKYAKGLETGTSKVAARPWLMPVVKQHIDTWGRELGIKVRAIKP